MSEDKEGKGKTDKEDQPPSVPKGSLSKNEPSAPLELAEDTDLPSPIRKMFEMMGFATAGPLSRYHPIFDKFNEAHIDKFLDYAQRDDDNAYRLRSTNRWFFFAYTILGTAFLVFLVVYLLPSNKDLLVEIVKLAAAFAGGVGTGYGLKAHLDKRDNLP